MKYILLNEDMQRARKVLKSVNIDETDKFFLYHIKKIVGNQLGYLGMFTYLYYIKEYDTSELENLMNVLNDNKRILNRLPKQVVKYDNIEELEDDINNINEWVRYNKEFVSKLVGNLKSKAREDEELKNAFIHLDDSVKNDLLSNFVIPKGSRYRGRYNDFREDCIGYMNRDRKGIDEVLKEIESTKGAYITYNQDGIIVAEIFNREASCQLGSSSWCISDDGEYWERYAGVKTKNKQYFIWNFNVPSTSIDSYVGVTILPNGKVETAHLKNDKHVDISTYLNKYNIPNNILTPLDINIDIEKIIDSVGIDIDVMEILVKNDLYEKYLDRIPRLFKMIFGIIDNDVEIPDIKKIIYSDNTDDIGEIRALFYFCNMKSNGDYDIENDYMIKLISTLNFKDKVYLLNKYQNVDTNFYGGSHNKSNRMSDKAVEFFFMKELSLNDKLEIGVGRYNGEIEISFKISVNEYIEDVLNISDEEYYGIQSLNSGSIMDYVDEDEFNYLYRYMNDECLSKISNYLNILRTNTPHPEITKKLDDIIGFFNGENDDYSDNFSEIFDIVSENIDENFSSPSKLYSYFENFWDQILLSAEEISDKDREVYQKAIKGEYNEYSGDGAWEIKIEDLSPLLEEYDEEWTDIEDWLESHPNDITDVEVSFYDYPSYHTYLGEVDITKACETLSKEFTKLLSEYDEDDLLERKKFIEYLNNNYKPVVHEIGWGKDKWFGYTMNVDKHLVVIPLSQVDANGDANIYTITNKFLEENERNEWYDRFDFSDLTIEKIKKYDSIKTKKINISDLILNKVTHDPNQLEFKFEKLKTFSGFLYQNKIG